MPRRSRASARCAYSERGVRCVRNGTGNPPLCRAHQVVVAEASQRAASRSAIGDAISELMDSGKVHQDTLHRAASELFEIFGGAPPSRPNGPRATRNGWNPAGGAEPPPWWGRPPPEPRVAPAELKRRRAIRDARIVLGFGPDEPLTADVIKARKRELALKHHPDRGGSLQMMTKVNVSADLLLASM